MLDKLGEEVKRIIVKELDSRWGGSCYGMSAVVVLSKRGSINTWEIQSNRYNLYSITKKNNDAVESIVNYYHMMQYLPKIKNIIGDMKKLPMRQQINKIIDCGEKASTEGKPFLIGFFYKSGGGHAIVGYGRNVVFL